MVGGSRLDRQSEQGKLKGDRMMPRDDTFWGRFGQLTFDGLAYVATAVAAAPAFLLLAFFCAT